MKMHAAKITDENKYTSELVDVKENEWIDIKPYAPTQNVFVQDYDNNVSFSWVDSNIEQKEDGSLVVNGLIGGIGPKAIKCWMMIPLPHEDFTGWQSEYVWDDERPKIKGREYLVCVEVKKYGRTTYKLMLDLYDPSRKSEWSRCNLESSESVIAWRDIPRPSTKKF